MDVHVPFSITRGLREREVAVTTAQDDSSTELPDDRLLDRASGLGRVLFSQDTDLLREAEHRQRTGVPFAGLIFAEQMRLSIGERIRDLELMAKILDPSDMQDRVEYLPWK